MNEYAKPTRKVGSLNGFYSHYNGNDDSDGACLAANTSVFSTKTFANTVCKCRSNSHSNDSVCTVTRKKLYKNDISNVITHQPQEIQQQQKQQQIGQSPPTVASYSSQRNNSLQNHCKSERRELNCTIHHRSPTQQQHQRNSCFSSRTSVVNNVSTTKEHHQNYSHPNSTTMDALLDPFIRDKKIVATSDNQETKAVTNNNPSTLNKVAPTEGSNVSVSSMSTSLRRSPSTSSTASFVSLNEESGVISPPMAFIPIFMPPFFQNSQTYIINSLSAPSIRKYHPHHNREYRGLQDKSITKVQTRVKVARSKSFTESIKLRRRKSTIPRNRAKVDVNRLQKHRRNFICNWFTMMIKFSTATVGQKLNTVGDKHQYKYYPSATINRLVHGFDPIERRIEQDDCMGQRNILPSSMEHIRNTYAKQCNIGSTKKHTFESPHTNAERYAGGGCEGNDILYLIVGLSNIFILQFIMVVLLFFAKHENMEVNNQ